MPIRGVVFGHVVAYYNFLMIILCYSLYIYDWKVLGTHPRTAWPSWFPQISDTFVLYPGTWISRIGLGTGATCLAMAQFFVYQTSKLNGTCGGLILLWVSIFACFLLSVVAAVCENWNEPTCRGMTSVHATSAVVFFVIYDIYMIIMSVFYCLNPSPRLSKTTTQLLGICTAISIISKARFLPADSQSLFSTSYLFDWPCWDNLPGPEKIALFEYFDVACIMSWTNLVISYQCADVEIEIHAATGHILETGLSDQEAGAGGDLPLGETEKPPALNVSMNICGLYATLMAIGAVLLPLLFLDTRFRLGLAL